MLPEKMGGGAWAEGELMVGRWIDRLQYASSLGGHTRKWTVWKSVRTEV